MFGLFVFTILSIPFFIIRSIAKYIFNRYRIVLLKFFVKLKYAFNDYDFMANLSIGIFASSLIALVVSVKEVVIIIYVITTVLSFVAMIDYNYKKRYNKGRKG